MKAYIEENAGSEFIIYFLKYLKYRLIFLYVNDQNIFGKVELL